MIESQAGKGIGVVTEIKEVSPGCHELTFRPRSTLKALPGQFLQVAVSEGRNPLLRRPLSIFDLLENERLCKLLFRVAGPGTALLSNFQAGDRLDYLGPLGNGFTIDPGSRRELLVAGGMGAAPLHFLTRVLRGLGKEVDFLLGLESSGRLPAFSSLAALGAKLELATDDGSAGRKGLVADLLFDYLEQNPAPKYIYCCGPRPMIEQVVKIAAGQKIPVQASHEERMACGVGVCMGCAFHHPENNAPASDYTYYQRLCLEGPVITYHHRLRCQSRC